jgi:hypothetical protein
MLLANVVIRPIDAALENREIALNRICVYVASHILASAVIDGTMKTYLDTPIM